MRIHSDSFERGARMAPEFALGAPDGFGGNRNPQLRWDEVPDGTRSFALLCIDTDAPTDTSLADKPGAEIPEDQPRTEFVHWTMVDIAADVRDIAAGACSDGVVKRGKPAPPGPAGSRQGLNGYTGWFKDNADMAGDYFGYDGPYPPANDLRLHRYFFRVFALGVPALELPAYFRAGDVFRAMHGHVLAEAAVPGTYSLHPNVGG